MTQARRPKEARVIRRAYTILKYYAEEHGVGAGESQVFGEVILSVIEQSPLLQEVLASDRSENRMAESLARSLTPEIHALIEGQLVVVLEHTQKWLAKISSTQSALSARLDNARTKLGSQFYVDSLQGQSFTTFGEWKIEATHNTELSASGVRSRSRTKVLSLSSSAMAEFSVAFAFAHALIGSSVEEPTNTTLRNSVARYLHAVVPEFEVGEVSRRDLLNRVLFCLETELRKLPAEIKKKERLVERLQTKISGVSY